MKKELYSKLRMKKLAEKITEKQISIVMLVAFLISLVPILMLAKYNYPGADDFSASYTLRHAWIETGNVGAVLEKAVEYVKYTYMAWSGLFMSMFWTCLQPGVFGEQYYGITTVISILLLLMGGFYFVHVLIEKYLGGNRTQVMSIGSIYLFLIIQCMPDGNEGLYWHSGVVNYTWAFAFLLMLTGITLSMMKEKCGKKKLIKVSLSFVLAIFVGGGNFITALQGCIWLTLLTIFSLIIGIKEKKYTLNELLKEKKELFIPVLTILTAFAISVLAPGNQVRMAGAGGGLSPIKAIVVSFIYCLEMPIKQWFSFPIVLILALAVPFMWNVVKKSQIVYSNPGVVAILGYCVASAAYTPNLYAQGNMLAGRLHDTAYFVFVTILMIVMFYIIGWLQQTMDIERMNCNEGYLSEKMFLYVMGMSLFLVGTSMLHIAINDGDTYIGSEAMMCIISGQAETYARENQLRLEMFHDSNMKNVEVSGFSNPPELLHFQDVTWDENDWVNHAVARYYGKDSVRRMN
ncbi:MAG: hypothetical protein IKW30_10090 [Lachnospiraceae bacterium]|nr:hypothetical protein [Lachnospiraceae bacterium]